MDKQTSRALAEIGRAIPKEWLRDMIVEKKDEEAESRQKLEWHVKKGDKYAKKLLDSGAFEATVTRTFKPGMESRIDNFIATRVDKLVKTGKIPRAGKDAFTQMMRAKMKT